ncbi:hypothetical protein GQ53DRAFT_823053 [Thozetella sp. PMI_491]|nr:hypothetical protein GQ53DRAFT_823053 [Thozetella sp. PMI_491]
MQKALTSALVALLPVAAWAGPLQARDELVDSNPLLDLNTIPMTTLQPNGVGTEYHPTLGWVGNFKAVFDLKNDIQLGWHGDIAEATVDAVFKSDTEQIVNMDDFSSALTHIDCQKPIVITFVDTETLDEAVNKWSWVNAKIENKVFFVTSAPACSKNGIRVAFEITGFVEDKAAKTITMKAADAPWDKVIQDGEITATIFGGNNGANEDTNSSSVQARGHEVDAFGVHKSYVGSLYSKSDAKDNKKKSIDIKCVDCGVDLEFTVQTRVSIGFFKINEASFTVTANAEARARFGIDVAASITYGGEKEIFSTVYGVNIPLICTLGVGPAVGVGYNAGLSGQGSVTFGAGARLTPNSQAKLCLKGCDSSRSGWDVSLINYPPQFDGTAKAELTLYAYTNIQGTAKIFGYGYSAGLSLHAPEFKGALTGQVKTEGGVCNNPAYRFGLTANVQAGVSLNVFAGSSKKELFSKYATLYNQCFGTA